MYFLFFLKNIFLKKNKEEKKRKQFDYKKDAFYLIDFINFLNDNNLKYSCLKDTEKPKSIEKIYSYKNLESGEIINSEKQIIGFILFLKNKIK